ncbi:hypothetical protein [Viridibacillus arvi]|uniref:hypothetical protein n=1 Tax=Viridibacillus arvi TaxID=263475 RepID=UPI0034CF713D
MGIDEKVNIEHPILQLEEKIHFLKSIQETVIFASKSNSTINNLRNISEQIHQFEVAVEILRNYHKPI